MARRRLIAERLEARLLLAAVPWTSEPDAHIEVEPAAPTFPVPAAFGAPTAGLSGPALQPGASSGSTAGPAKPADLPAKSDVAYAIAGHLQASGHGAASSTSAISSGADADSHAAMGQSIHETHGVSQSSSSTNMGEMPNMQPLAMQMNRGLSIGHLAGGDAMPTDASGNAHDSETMYAKNGSAADAAALASGMAIGGSAATDDALGTNDDAMSDQLAGDMGTMHGMAMAGSAVAAMNSHSEMHYEHESVDSLMAGWTAGTDIDASEICDANQAALAARAAGEMATLIAANHTPQTIREFAAAANVDRVTPAPQRADIRLVSTAASPRVERSQRGLDGPAVAAAIAAIAAIGGTLLCELHLRRRQRLLEVATLDLLTRRAA